MRKTPTHKLNTPSSKPTEKKDFSTFFRTASDKEKKDLLMKVLMESNEDQRALLKRYSKLKKKAA